MYKTLCVLGLVILACIGCDRTFALLNPDMRGEFNFDVVGSKGAAFNYPAALSKRAAGDSLLFCNFSKFEIQVLVVHVTMSDSLEKEVSNHLLLDRANGDGVRVNLVTEKLSDKVSLVIKDPYGTKVEAIDFGIEKTITVCGYIDSLGTRYRSTASGFIADTNGPPQDYVMVADDSSTWFNLRMWDGVQTKATDVKGISLPLAKKPLFESIRFAGRGSIELKWPMENAVVFRLGKWRLAGTYWTCPFIAEQVVYEKYYLRRAGSSHWTDVMKALFDKNGNALPGQTVLGPNIDVAQNALVHGSNVFGLGLEASLANYSRDFTVLRNSTFMIKFQNDLTGTNYNVLNAFYRGDHSGTMTMSDGTVINYECIKVE